MKRQIVIIGGGTPFDTYKDYISFLKNREIDLDRFRWQPDWKNTLGSNLGDGYDVLLLKMPNSTNAVYKEWKLWFERIVPLLDKEVILVGHSLGGIFLAKYLSENKFSKKILATLLVAAPYDDANSEESLAKFKLPAKLASFSKLGGKIFLLYSEDDPLVPLAQSKKYAQALPDAQVLVFRNLGHFKVEAFPQLIKLIRSLE